MPDNVNHPAHYETGKYECIEVMQEVFGIEAVQNFCLLNAFKYLYRTTRKNGVEDIEKAAWYLDKWKELKKKREPIPTVDSDTSLDSELSEISLLFLKAIRAMYRDGHIQIKDLRTGKYNTNNPTFDQLSGYRDKEYFYFYPKLIYAQMQTFFWMNNENLSIDKKTLYTQLMKDEVIYPGSRYGEPIAVRTKSIKKEHVSRLWVKAKYID